MREDLFRIAVLLLLALNLLVTVARPMIGMLEYAQLLGQKDAQILLLQTVLQARQTPPAPSTGGKK